MIWLQRGEDVLWCDVDILHGDSIEFIMACGR